MWKIFIWLRAAAALVGGIWLVVTFTPLVDWWARLLARPWGDCQGDVMIVLSGSALTDDLLGTNSYWRSVYAVREMRRHVFRQVIFSGGNRGGPGNKTTGELMRDFVRAHGIDMTNVTVESVSSSTRGNAVESVALLRQGAGPHGKVVLLTSDAHVWRALRVFRKAGLMEVDACPVPDVIKRYGNWDSRAELFVELVTETAKIGWYRWQGWI